ncbi:DUF4386 domain-containing protein [Arthrobacter sp. CJ23]|uniref:DUF4386 domain-containing protein n=1 Tax=Arthrobacter sp. CJ23 TaxID=2972479 RepID=UPI00215CB9CF|nr:DUF4386 domain-containing protein [Arthrobacter sp. CJ23]UVJ41013.1 DUF4386 domain-containing protein [Arthrobacter sp. CJ23]
MQTHQPRPVLTAALLAAGALASNAAFIWLGSVYDYPAVLSRPAAEALASFHDKPEAVVAGFSVLSAGAALMAPIAVLAARLQPGVAMRAAAWAGIVAAVVQLAGLLRWVTLVPMLGPDDTGTFTLLNLVLGKVLGEWFGYLFTAAWTVLVAHRFGMHRRWFAWWGYASALLIAAGLTSPLGLESADIANFAGYVLWSLWLLAFAALILRDRALKDGILKVRGTGNRDGGRAANAARPAPGGAGLAGGTVGSGAMDPEGGLRR